MKINNSVYNQNFCANPKTLQSVRKLVPLSEYKGKLLKLTPEDEIKISKLQAECEKLDYQYYEMAKYISLSQKVSKSRIEALKQVKFCIESLQAQIRDIKINRLSQQ